MVLQTVLEPVVFGLEAYEDSGWSSVTSDDDLLGRSQPQVAGEVIFTSASATRRGRGALVVEPRLRERLWDDREDVDLVLLRS